MELLKLFQTKSKAFYLLLLVLGMVSSLTNIGILLMINVVLGGDAIVTFGENNYLAFIGLMLLSFFTTLFFQHYMVQLTNSIMYSLELSIINKVRNASYESFEKLGTERLYAAISDARVLSRVPEVFVTFINSSITLVCSLAYLFWVSFWAGLTVLIIMTGLLLIYLYRNRRIENDLNKVRDLQDGYYNSLRELLAGFKQIRISPLRNFNLFNNYILSNRSKAKTLSISVSKRYIANELTGVYSWYVVLGIIIFLLPAIFKINAGQLAAFITTILFMMSPVSQLIMVQPFYTGFKIAVERINKIDEQLKVNSLPTEQHLNAKSTFYNIRFENVLYRYTKEEASFELEFEDFQLTAGEIVFIIGGNGSGKTTFINLLTGLCKPVSGRIFIDEQEVSWEAYSSFCTNMAVVYTDQYLFKENYDEHDLSENNSFLSNLVKKFNLQGILRIDHEKQRVDTKLSKGQQKRLSLLLSMLEEKPLLVLDEWAAEQDPHNRRLFYTEWLAAVRNTGKTIIAVTHDDDFYDTADRIVKFHYGKIISDTDQVRQSLK